MSLRNKLSRMGINIGVLAVSIIVFVLAFFGLNAYASSQKPPETEVLATTRQLHIGDTIRPSDVVKVTVFQDQATSTFIPASAITNTVGGVVTLPVDPDQPLLKEAVLAPSTVSTRLASVLADRPEMSLIPLPLDENNIVAPPLEAFLPGDYIDVTVVIDKRPRRTNQDDASGQLAGSQQVPITTTVQQQAQQVQNPVIAESLERLRPPVAKSLFPQGARVMAVYGQPPMPSSSDDGGAEEGQGNTVLPSTLTNRSPLLLLLVPSQQREQLSLALQRGDMVFVSLLGQTSEEPEQTPGFTYDDMEKWLEQQRIDTFEEELASDAEPAASSDASREDTGPAEADSAQSSTSRQTGQQTGQQTNGQ